MKKRLDILLKDQGLAKSRQQAQALILSGRVLVDDIPKDKAGTLIDENAKIRIKGVKQEYASRGGLKLEKALKEFNVSPENLICLDIGASTGGFTDCLLKNGAKLVMAVDVGYGQLAWELRQDERVIVFERMNARYLEPGILPEEADLVVIDVSFISLKLVVPAVLNVIKKTASIICLVKPQFEAGKSKVGKGGVVKDPEVHEKILEDMEDFFSGLELKVAGKTTSPILGPKGNREFLMMLCRDSHS